MPFLLLRKQPTSLRTPKNGLYNQLASRIRGWNAHRWNRLVTDYEEDIVLAQRLEFNPPPEPSHLQRTRKAAALLRKGLARKARLSLLSSGTGDPRDPNVMNHKS